MNIKFKTKSGSLYEVDDKDLRYRKNNGNWISIVTYLQRKDDRFIFIHKDNDTMITTTKVVCWL